ncbi:MAG: phage virion morphogenesis protein [Thermotogae bacterium]|jgi:phage virion morphogenesis protein|nr:phage virion morphogenesis protein [Thermotogota bacterium]MCL5033086.1 phage virion morphogenesis protein [Thermotogota bacterium]
MKVEIRGDTDEKLKLIMSHVSDLSKPMSEIGQVMKRSVIENFQAGGHPRWKPLSQRYLAWKLSHGYTSQILVLTHRLMQSFSVQTDSKSARVFTGVKYAARHNFGDNLVPQRQFMMFQEEDVSKIKEIISKFVGE